MAGRERKARLIPTFTIRLKATRKGRLFVESCGWVGMDDGWAPSPVYAAKAPQPLSTVFAIKLCVVEWIAQ